MLRPVCVLFAVFLVYSALPTGHGATVWEDFGTNDTERAAALTTAVTRFYDNLATLDCLNAIFDVSDADRATLVTDNVAFFCTILGGNLSPGNPGPAACQLSVAGTTLYTGDPEIHVVAKAAFAKFDVNTPIFDVFAENFGLAIDSVLGTAGNVSGEAVAVLDTFEADIVSNNSTSITTPCPGLKTHTIQWSYITPTTTDVTIDIAPGDQVCWHWNDNFYIHSILPQPATAEIFAGVGTQLRTMQQDDACTPTSGENCFLKSATKTQMSYCHIFPHNGTFANTCGEHTNIMFSTVIVGPAPTGTDTAPTDNNVPGDGISSSGDASGLSGLLLDLLHSVM